MYAFPFTDEADLFEEAQVELQIEGRQMGGSIVSISVGFLKLAIKEDLGTEIEHAILLIDATALITALADKIEQVTKGEILLNREIADAVAGNRRASNTAQEIDYKPRTINLNAEQLRAHNQALTGPLTWIMGPPGCGKTKTLGEIIRSAFEAQCRVLVCSNTNKAVDQVLYEVCKSLGIEHEAMQEGRVVRLGRIADDKLKVEYADYVTVDGIARRLSKEFVGRKIEIEQAITRIDERTERARRIVAEFRALDHAEQSVAKETKLLHEIEGELQRAEEELSECEERQTHLQTELEARRKALFGIFRRSEATIEQDLRLCATQMPDLEEKTAAKATAVRQARKSYDSAFTDRDKRKQALASENRVDTNSVLEKADIERERFAAELREIDSKISALQASILREATILGTTCTKAYLSSKELGQADMVIIDEASMVMLPMAWFAAGLARQRVVVCGDFHQIPPIVQSEQQAIVDAVGQDAFAANNIKSDDDDRLVYLAQQYRMEPLICDLISGPMYRHRLKTSKDRDTRDCLVTGALVPPPFEATLTIIDTSELWPFESQNAFFSRFNLMHALLARNLAWYLRECGAITTNTDLGVCTPYAAQAKLIQQLVRGENLDDYVQAGTVHRYQGDQRRIILLEIPESHGGSRRLGQFVQGIPPEHIGARLINVAVSRAQCRLIIMANLTYLDKKLPAQSLLRSILFDVQEHGKVVPGQEVLGLRPIESDLSGLIHKIPFDEIAETLGLFDEAAFERAFEYDIGTAKDSVVIYSGYVTPSRVGKLGDLFRAKINEGVRIRCVTRPPQSNGSIPPSLGREALDMLEGIGVTVDCRANIHQKVCLIDNRIVWMGSLNALSHAGRSDETMTRAVGPGYGAAVAAHMSKRRVSSEKAAAAVADAENPRCPRCDSRTVYREGRYGPYYTCESDSCDWSASQRQFNRPLTKPTGISAAGPPCPKCASPTRLRKGRFGAFFGCTRYPECNGTIDIATLSP